MDVNDFLRAIAYHSRVVLGLAAAAAIAVAVAVAAIPNEYSSTAILRVAPGTVELTTDSLPTAVGWYVGFSQVPSVAADAGSKLTPPQSGRQVLDATQSKESGDPGEIQVIAQAPTQDEAVALSSALATSMVETVADDETAQIAGTSLRLFIPAQPDSAAGASPAVAGLSTGIISFVLLGTIIGLFSRRINWKVSQNSLSEVSEQFDVPVVALQRDDAASRGSACARLAAQARTSSLTLLNTDGSVPEGAATDLTDQIRDAGLDVVLGQQPAQTGVLYVPEPNDGSPEAMAFVGVANLPVALLVSRRGRVGAVRRKIRELTDMGLTLIAVVDVG